MRQLDHGQPETVDVLHDFEESIEVHRLGDETVRMVQITPQDVVLRRRGRRIVGAQ